MLTAAVATAALLAGLAGAWSPCGFSMVDTVAAAGRRWAVLAAAIAFAAGALGGAVVTFGGLALVGAELGWAGGLAAALACGALLVAAAGDAAGRRLVPQVRRQVPESWRRILPLPVAGGLYGILLGLGFTTFVLSFATYGLAVVCLALGDPGLGMAAGIAFGAGRALPVLVLGPLQERDAGIAAAAAMAERPAILRGLRGAAAVALLASAAALALDGAPAHAQASVFTRGGSDPSVTAGMLAYEDSSGRGLLVRGDRVDLLPGGDPAVTTDAVAWHEPGRIVLADPESLVPFTSIPADGVDAIAVSPQFVVWRSAGRDGHDRLLAYDRAAAGEPRTIAIAATTSAELGAPAIEDARVVFHRNSRVKSRIVQVDLATGRRRRLRSSRTEHLLNPSLSGGVLAYVRSSARRQELRLAFPDAVEQIVYSTTPTARRDSGFEAGRRPHRAGYRGGRPAAPRRPARGVTRTLWTTALSPTEAYVTVLRARRGAAPDTVILRVPR